MKQLDPKAKLLFFIQYLIPLTFVFFFIAILGSVLLTLNAKTNEPFIMSITISFGLALILDLLLTALVANLSYKYYKYALVQEGIKMEKGVIFKKYSLIPYQKVQNIDITRGIFSRMLGLSELHIQTAGASGYYGSEIYIPGLDPKTAEDLRDKILSKIKKGDSHGV